MNPSGTTLTPMQLLLQIDIAEGTSDAAILEMVKKSAKLGRPRKSQSWRERVEDWQSRRRLSKVKVALRARSESDRASAV